MRNKVQRQIPSIFHWKRDAFPKVISMSLFYLRCLKVDRMRTVKIIAENRRSIYLSFIFILTRKSHFVKNLRVLNSSPIKSGVLLLGWLIPSIKIAADRLLTLLWVTHDSEAFVRQSFEDLNQEHRFCWDGINHRAKLKKNIENLSREW